MLFTFLNSFKAVPIDCVLPHSDLFLLPYALSYDFQHLHAMLSIVKGGKKGRRGGEEEQEEEGRLGAQGLERVKEEPE